MLSDLPISILLDTMDQIKIQRINSHNWQDFQKDLEGFCKTSELDLESPAAINYHWQGWQDNPASLMYVLTQEKRYDAGFLDLLYKQDRLVAVSGCYTADWNSQVLIIGSRAYTLTEHRGTDWHHGEYLFPRQWEYATQQGYRAAIISFNEYNLRLLRFIEVASRGRFSNKQIPDFYRHFHVMPSYHTVKFTPQRIAIRLAEDATWEEFYERLCPPIYH